MFYLAYLGNPQFGTTIDKNFFNTKEFKIERNNKNRPNEMNTL